MNKSKGGSKKQTQAPGPKHGKVQKPVAGQQAGKGRKNTTSTTKGGTKAPPPRPRNTGKEQQLATRLVNQSGLSSAALSNLLDQSAKELEMCHNIRVKGSRGKALQPEQESSMACDDDNAPQQPSHQHQAASNPQLAGAPPAVPSPQQQQQPQAACFQETLSLLGTMAVDAAQPQAVVVADSTPAAGAKTAGPEQLGFSRSAEGSHVP